MSIDRDQIWNMIWHRGAGHRVVAVTDFGQRMLHMIK